MNSISLQSKEEYFTSLWYDYEEVDQILNLYKIYQKAQGERETIHHLIPVCRSGSDIDRNQKKLKAKVHQTLHAFFWNQEPIEQLETVLDINRRILTKDVRDKIKDTLYCTKWSLYVPYAFR